MPRTKSGPAPSYRLHRRTGQAVVTINGKDHYLGPHGFAESRREYARLILEWEAESKAPVDDKAGRLTIAGLILACNC